MNDDSLILALKTTAGKFMMKTKSGSWLRFCIGSGIFLLCLGKAVSYVEPVEMVRLTLEYLASARGAAN